MHTEVLLVWNRSLLCLENMCIKINTILPKMKNHTTQIYFGSAYDFMIYRHRASAERTIHTSMREGIKEHILDRSLYKIFRGFALFAQFLYSKGNFTSDKPCKLND